MDPNIKIGLACAGGAIEGAAYEVGVLNALEESLDGIHFNDLDIYVGVSAWAFITACLANDITPSTLAKGFISKSHKVMQVTPETFFKPAIYEYWDRIERLPKLVSEAIWNYVTHPLDLTLEGALYPLTSLLPVGIFSNDHLRRYLEQNFRLEGRTDNFRELKKKLRIIATDLESSDVVHFGEPPFDDIPISKAVQASTALPVLYTPVNIKGSYYIDGVARRTVHASVALEEGSHLVFCINPIVPVDTKHKKENGSQHILDRGLTAVLSQTFRTMIHSRMLTGFKNYEYRYPDADFVVIEPSITDTRLFFTNIFSFQNRKEVCEYGYQSTRQQLLKHYNELSGILAKYDIHINREVLLDSRRTLYGQIEDNHQDSIKSALKRTDEVLSHLDELLKDLEATSNNGHKREKVLDSD